MKNFIIIGVLLISCFSFGQTPSNDPNYFLSWEDNFDGTTLNTAIWKKRDWFDPGDHNDSPYESTAQVSISLADNVEVSGGSLKLHLKRETISCGYDYNDEWGWEVDNLASNWYCTWQGEFGQPYKFSGAEVYTRPAYQNSYGYYEARIRMPYKYGVWNSFWTFRGDDVSGNAAEIDIFETLGRLPNEDLIKTNVHLEYCGDDNVAGFGNSFVGNENSCTAFAEGELCSGILTYDAHVCANDYSQWHIYGLEWTPNNIIWYIDGVAVRSIPNPGVHNDVWVEFGIVTDPNYPPTDPSAFDVVHEVDYFRYYELNNDCNAVVNDCPFWFGGWDHKVKKSITIGGCNEIQPVGTAISLRAQDFVTINGAFEVPLGAELYIDVNNCF